MYVIVVELCSNYIRLLCFFFFKQKTAYEMRISDWSSDVCSSDLSTGRRYSKPKFPENFGALGMRLPFALNVGSPKSFRPLGKRFELGAPGKSPMRECK